MNSAPPTDGCRLDSVSQPRHGLPAAGAPGPTGDADRRRRRAEVGHAPIGSDPAQPGAAR